MYQSLFDDGDKKWRLFCLASNDFMSRSSKSWLKDYLPWSREVTDLVASVCLSVPLPVQYIFVCRSVIKGQMRMICYFCKWYTAETSQKDWLDDRKIFSYCMVLHLMYNWYQLQSLLLQLKVSSISIFFPSFPMGNEKCSMAIAQVLGLKVIRSVLCVRLYVYSLSLRSALPPMNKLPVNVHGVWYILI